MKRKIPNQDEGDLFTGTRVCGICNEKKPMDQFYWISARKDGRYSRKYRNRICKSCWNDLGREQKAKRGPEAERKRNRRTYLMRNYGMTLEDEQTLLEAQGNKCAICLTLLGIKADKDSSIKKLNIDHDPNLMIVRGILCNNCNMGIGLLQHNLENLSRAVSYLQREGIPINRS